MKQISIIFKSKSPLPLKILSFYLILDGLFSIIIFLPFFNTIFLSWNAQDIVYNDPFVDSIGLIVPLDIYLGSIFIFLSGAFLTVLGLLLLKKYNSKFVLLLAFLSSVLAFYKIMTYGPGAGPLGHVQNFISEILYVFTYPQLILKPSWWIFDIGFVIAFFSPFYLIFQLYKKLK